MTTDPFTTAARERAESLRPDHAFALLGDQVLDEVEELVDMAEWARSYLAAQEPDDAAIRVLATTTAHTGQDIVEAARVLAKIAQEPTDAEVREAGIAIVSTVLNLTAEQARAGFDTIDRDGYWSGQARAALSAARRARGGTT